jgi:hypothetical protein
MNPKPALHIQECSCPYPPVPWMFAVILQVTRSNTNYYQAFKR